MLGFLLSNPLEHLLDQCLGESKFKLELVITSAGHTKLEPARLSTMPSLLAYQRRKSELPSLLMKMMTGSPQ